jgi:hypothetical protein
MTAGRPDTILVSQDTTAILELRDTESTQHFAPERGTIALQSDAAVSASGLSDKPRGTTHGLPPDYPVYYFFYETLSIAANLKRIIDLQEPRLRKEKIIGYALAKWGDYPALINGKPGQEVSG